MFFTYIRVVIETAIVGWLTWLIWPYIVDFILWVIDVLTPDPPIIYEEYTFQKP